MSGQGESSEVWHATARFPSPMKETENDADEFIQKVILYPMAPLAIDLWCFNILSVHLL